MKLIAKIALPLIIVASLAGCSSTSSDHELAESLQSELNCPFTPEQIEEDRKDQPEIALIRRAVANHKPTADMIKEDVSIAQAQMLLDIYDSTMKSCK